ncbi:MAG: GNAT family N-acetyltransferase [Anaerolineales bacterium]|nr:GNAT family N-acetyltransferase [Anaerolineales bacterium]
MHIPPITLTGRVVRLEPLAESHIPDLTIAAADESIWRYMRYGNITTEQQMRGWVQSMLAEQARGTDLPFAVVHIESGRAIGATRYLNISPQNLALEIGGTWYAVPYQRSAVNTECKYLLLEHAFERLGCIRVQFKTDPRNQRSQRALERIGAVKEGLLRKHMVLPDGFIRDSIFYSIIDTEWPTVKTDLEVKLGYHPPAYES